MRRKPSAEEVVSKLSDREVLRNYCVFAGMHRAIAADTLLGSLTREPNQRRSVGLEIAANFVAALEDIALWYFVLKEWKSEGSLFDLLDSTQVTDQPGDRYSTQTAVGKIWNGL